MSMESRQFTSANPVFYQWVVDSSIAQESVSDRLHYIDIATEAVMDSSKRGKLVQKLYNDILKKTDFDFGKIPDSKGALTRYIHYNKLNACYDCLIEILNGDKTEALVLYKRLNDILLESQKDFEMGFKFNIEFLQLTYNMMVLTLHQLIDIAICETTDYLRDVVQIQMATNKKRTKFNNVIMVNTKNFIKSYDNGEWRKIVQSFKTNRENFLGGGIGEVFAVIGLVSLIAAGVLVAVRAITYFYHNSKVKLRDYAESEAELLRNHMEVYGQEDGEAAINKQKKMLAKLERRAGIIEARMERADKDTVTDLAVSAREDYRPSSYDAPDTGEFELI